MVELGCGTGTFTEAMAARGYDMIGIDNAPEMLNIASGKRERSGLPIMYLEQDMRELDLYSTAGTFVSSITGTMEIKNICGYFLFPWFR